MANKLKLGFVILALAAAGCAGDPLNSAHAGATLPAAPAVDAVPAHTRAGAPVTGSFGTVVTGRDWNCPRCYK